MEDTTEMTSGQFPDNNLTNATCDGLGEASFPTLLSLAVIYFTGLIICATIYILKELIKWLRGSKEAGHKNNTDVNPARKCIRLFRGYMRQLKSGDTVPGKIILFVTLLLNIAYLCLATYRSLPPLKVEECISITDPAIIVELIIVILLFLYFILRLLATSNVLLFWVNLHTIVDVLTLPHIFITIALGVDYIGLRALRFLWMTQITTVLQFIRLIRSQNVLDIVNLMVYFVILWLTSAGILYVIEAEGDFWEDTFNGSTDSVLIYVYLIMVTVSTVGYGDFSPVTSTGRAFMILFIVVGLAFFAAILPTLVDIVVGYYNRTQYAKFDTTRVPRHVIVCGHITATTASDFLKDFLHPDRGDKKTHILFLHPQRPEQDLKNVLRTYYTRVQFLLGSALNASKLKQARINGSVAVFILADKLTNDPKDEDHANMLRAVSIKNTTTQVPVIIQLVHSFSKRKVIEIDGWLVGRDIAICLNQLKLGVLAQNCLCPGFSTLLSNIFYASDAGDDDQLQITATEKWKKHYLSGTSNELYSGPFSEAFNGKTFHEAAAICFNKLNLVLVALDRIGETNQFYINPTPRVFRGLRINSETMLGYFVAQDQHQVFSVSIYCECCIGNRHISAKNLGLDFKMQLNARRRSSNRPLERGYTLTNFAQRIPKLVREDSVHIDLVSDESPPTSHRTQLNGKSPQNGTNGTLDESPPTAKKSLTNGTHVQGREDGEDLITSVPDGPTPESVVSPAHVNVSVMSSPSVDMDDMVNDNEDELKEDGDVLVHLCNPVPLEDSILNPDLLSVSDMSFRAKSESLRDHIILCLFADGNSPVLGLQNFLKPLRQKYIPQDSIKPVVIICDKAFIEKEWPIIRNFPKVYLVIGSPLLWTSLRAAKVSRCSVCVVLTSLPNSDYHDPAINDKEVILCSLSLQKKLRKLNKKVSIITDLRHESNVQFLDFGDEDTPDERIYKAQPFACGEAFSVSMFDSVTSTAFHGPGALYLVEDLIHSAKSKNVCQMISVPISNTDYSGKTYKEFYNAQLKEYSVCLGLSRRLPSNDMQRYVITCPDPNLVLVESDHVFLFADV